MTSRIISLETENIKKVKAVSITANPHMNIISGKNGNGKSSTLDSIEMALGGGRAIPDMPVRAGESTARIVLKTEDLTITRHWTDKEKNYLKVEAKELGKIQNAQGLLDNLVGNLSFDPLEFSTMEPKKRVEILKNITGLDFSALDKEYKEKFSERTVKKKEVDTLAVTVGNFKVHELEAPKISLEEAKKQKAEIETANKLFENRMIYEIPAKKREISESEYRISSLNKIIADAQKVIDQNKKMISDTEKTLASQIQELSQLESEINLKEKISTEEVDKTIEAHRAYESSLGMAKQRDAVIKNRDNAQLEWDKLNNRLEEILKEKQDQLSKAEMPIKGLSFADNDILFNEIPFIQLSTSEQIQVSMSIAMALSPKLRIIIIKNGSLMDAEAIQKVEKMAIEKDFQVWIEKVADGPEANTFYIHDGELVNFEA